MSGDTELRISRILAPVTTLGPGRRVGLWVQGCSIGCRGCASMDTWDADGGRALSVETAVEHIISAARASEATGLTITGGEPFQQAGACAELVGALRGRWPGPEPVDVLVFTGYSASAARRTSEEFWKAVDAVIAGPYRRDRPSTHPLVASENQTVEAITDLGEERLGALGSGRRMQVGVDNGAVTLTGLPDPGDLDRLQQALQVRGIRFRSVSWGS